MLSGSSCISFAIVRYYFIRVRFNKCLPSAGSSSGSATLQARNGSGHFLLVFVLAQVGSNSSGSSSGSSSSRSLIVVPS